MHVEVQSRKDYKKELGKRLFNYFIWIRDKHKHPITAIVILADSNKLYRPKVYVEEFMGTKLSYEFNSYKIADQSEEALRADPNPFAVVILTALLAINYKKATNDQLKDIKHDLYEQMKKRNMPKNMREAIYDFITYYVQFDNQEYLINFESEIQAKEGRKTTMGTREYLLDKAKREGEEKKNIDFVTNLILEFGFSDEQASKAATVSLGFVRKIRASLTKKLKN